MIYQKLELAVNDPESKQEFAVWQKVINKIANKETAIKQGYFWHVSEAKLIEISAVLSGSNELTMTVDNKLEFVIEPEEVKEKKGIDFAYLVNNIDRLTGIGL